MCQIVKRPEVRFSRPREIFTSHSAAIMYVVLKFKLCGSPVMYALVSSSVSHLNISFLNHIFPSMHLPST